MGSRAFAGRRSAALACAAAALTGAAVVCAAPVAATEGVVPAPAANGPAAQANRAPVAADDAATAQDGASATIDLFANDVDPDGDPLSLVGGTSAGHGTVSFEDTVATYTPDAEFVGVDSFTYLVGDGRGGTSSATVTVMVVRTGPPAAGEAVTGPDAVGGPLTQAPPAPRPWPTRATPDPAAPVAAAPAKPAAAAPAKQAAAAPAKPAAAAPAPAPAVTGAVTTSAARPATHRTRTAVAPAATASVAAAQPVHAPQEVGRRMGPAAVPYVAQGARPAALPFTGGAADTLLPLGAGLLLVGALLTATGRRRPATA